jgi:uncharacterized protein YutE (UPF0331/DUF86 family)
MDKDVVRTKLESLSRCILRIEDKTPASLDAFRSDVDAQDIIVLNLERAVQLCVDLGSHALLDCSVSSPDSMAATFLALGEAGVLTRDLAQRMSKAAGFRNIAVHEYASMDWSIVYSIITTQLDDFREFAAAFVKIIQ